MLIESFGAALPKPEAGHGSTSSGHKPLPLHRMHVWHSMQNSLTLTPWFEKCSNTPVLEQRMHSNAASTHFRAASAPAELGARGKCTPAGDPCLLRRIADMAFTAYMISRRTSAASLRCSGVGARGRTTTIFSEISAPVKKVSSPRGPGLR